MRAIGTVKRTWSFWRGAGRERRAGRRRREMSGLEMGWRGMAGVG